LGINYFRDSEIPDCPKMGQHEVFNFSDENIPTIENARPVEPEKPIQPERFDISSLTNMKLTPEVIQNLMAKVNNKELSQEERSAIIQYLQAHLNNPPGMIKH
jgi:hypothetical protein